MTAKKPTPAKKAGAEVEKAPLRVPSTRVDKQPGKGLALRAETPMTTTYGTGANDVTITVTHPNSSFTGVITVLGTVKLPFTSGTASVTVDARTLGAIEDLGFAVTIGTPGPAPAYDANLDTLVEPIVSNAASTTNVALRAAFDARYATPADLTGKASLIEAVNTVAASGAALTLPDVTSATIHDVTLTANCTLTFPAQAAGKSFLVRLTQDGTGSRTVTWPASVKWPGGVAPTLSTAAGKQDVISFVSVGGSNWLGFVAGLDVR